MVSVEQLLDTMAFINQNDEYSDRYPEVKRYCEKLEVPIKNLYNALLQNGLIADYSKLDESHGNKKHNGPKSPIAAMKHGEWEKRKDYVGDGFKSNGGAHRNNREKRQEKVSIRNYDKYIDEAVNESLNNFKKRLLK